MEGSERWAGPSVVVPVALSSDKSARADDVDTPHVLILPGLDLTRESLNCSHISVSLCIVGIHPICNVNVTSSSLTKLRSEVVFAMSLKVFSVFTKCMSSDVSSKSSD